MDPKVREAVEALACQARNAAQMMVRPAVTGFVENRVFFQEAYEALQGAIDAYDEALSAGREGAGEAEGVEAFVCRCADRKADALGICHRCGGFDDAH